MDDHRTEDQWRTTGLLVATCFCFVLLIGFSYSHFSKGESSAGWFAIIGLPFTALTIYGCLQKPFKPWWTAYPAIGYLLAMLMMMIHVWTLYGGAALMWLIAIPSFTIFSLGARQGLLFSAIGFVLVLSGIYGANHVLTEAYATRFVCAYLLVAGLTYAFERKREQVTREVAEAQARIKTLEGLLRICGWCHRKMRDENGDWVSTEQFFQDRAPVQFSHGLCPDCESRLDQIDELPRKAGSSHAA